MAGGTLASLGVLLGLNKALFTSGLAEARGEMASFKDTTGSAMKSAGSSAAGTGGMFTGMSGAILKATAVGGIALIGLGIATGKMAADYQTSMTQLVTGAGESTKAIGMVGQGILNMAGEVGQTPKALAAGLYLIESAGYHGAAGLAVLRSAAEGAATGGAQMDTVANILTTTLHDYAIPADRANAVTSALVQTVALGKTHLQDLATSLGTVLPVAAALGVSFPQTAAAIATMTNAGYSAQRASMGLKNELLALSAPSGVATKSMAAVGLTAQQVKNALAEQGLTGALALVQEHVGKKFPASSVAYVTAMKNILGGTTGYTAALMEGGKNLPTYEANVRSIAGALDGSAKSVQGFSLIQKDAAFQTDRVKASLEAAGIRIGQIFLPIITTVMKTFANFINDLMSGASVGDALRKNFGLVGAVLGAVADAIGFVIKNFNTFKPIIFAVVGALIAFETAMAIQSMINGVSRAIGILTGVYAMLTTGEASAATAADALAISEAAAALPIIAIVAAVAAVIAIVVLLVTHWKQVEAVAVAVWKHILAVVMSVWDSIKGVVLPVMNVIVSVVRTAVGIIVQIFTIEFNIIRGIVNVALQAIIIIWNILSTTVKIIVQALWDTVAQIFKIGVGVVELIFTALSDALLFVWNHIKGVVLPVVEFIAGAIKLAFQIVATVLKGIWDGVTSVIKACWDGVTSFIKGVVSTMVGIFQGLASVLSGIWNGIAGVVTSVWNGIVGVIKGAVNAIIGVIDAIIGGVNKVTGAIPFVGKNLQIPMIPKWHAGGGYFDQPTVIGVGEAGGEWVLNESQMSSLVSNAGGLGSNKSVEQAIADYLKQIASNTGSTAKSSAATAKTLGSPPASGSTLATVRAS